MGYTEAHKKATLKYMKENQKRIAINMHIGEYTLLKSYLDANEQSVSGYIKELISNDANYDYWKRKVLHNDK